MLKMSLHILTKYNGTHLIIDVARAITGHSADYSAQAVRNVCDQYPEVSEKITDLKFKGRGQRLTPVTDVHGIIEFVMLLPGKHAANVRRQAAELLVRYLSGDLAIIDEVCALRGLQEELAVERKTNLKRYVSNPFWTFHVGGYTKPGWRL